ncbi:MAG: type II toxin-antitoxin system VapB family antitoxin [Longimicrobiales bacterium]
MLNIKNPEAYRLARELALARGTSLTEAVTTALGESLRSQREPEAGIAALLEEVRQVQALVASLPDRDRRTPEEILGYDEHGLPR